MAKYTYLDPKQTTPSMIPTTVLDRLRLAWGGWCTRTKRNPQWDVERAIQERKEMDRALNSLPSDVREMIDAWPKWSGKGDATPPEHEVGKFVAALAPLYFIDQLALMFYVCNRNPMAVQLRPAAQWAAKNSPAIASLFK